MTSSRIFSLFFIFIFGLFQVSCVVSPYGQVRVSVNQEFDQGKIKRIAVVPFDLKAYRGFDQGGAHTIADWYGTELMMLGYQVIERQHVEKILAEQQMQSSDLFNQQKAFKIGNLLGVQAMLFGNAAGQPNLFTSTIKLIDIETGTTIWAMVVETNLPKNAAPHLKKALDDYYSKKMQTKK